MNNKIDILLVSLVNAIEYIEELTNDYSFAYIAKNILGIEDLQVLKALKEIKGE
jgi:hypothetical protein